MSRKEMLLERLGQIALSVKNTNKARALIGFGSTGIETERLDEYSDLDFLAVTKNEFKQDFGDNLSWLTDAAPISYCFIDKYGAYNVFFADGIFCEFGICNEDEVSKIPHSEGRIIWCEDDFDHSLRMSSSECGYGNQDIELSIGEVLTNLYVGLCRYARGEKLAAHRYIQRQALDCLLACSNFMAKENPYYKDNFTIDRRYEIHYPDLAVYLPAMIQGYEKSPEAALAILKFTETYFSVNCFMKTQIINLANKCKTLSTP